jgi:hypothetical protein
MVGTMSLLPILFPPSIPDQRGQKWSEFAVRKQRYRILAAFADGTIYNGIDKDFVFNASYLMGGFLDGDAGPGPERGGKPTALPILTGEKADQDAVSRAVASIWRASNWQGKKSLYTRYGASLGDVGLEAYADEKRKIVRLRVIHPAEIADKDEDPSGNLKSYIIERYVRDDQDRARLVKYREEVTNKNGTVTIRTFKGEMNAPYEWPDTPGKEWPLKWSFAPMVMVKHIDTGFHYGESAIVHAIFKSVERDSQGSSLSDNVLKCINGLWLVTGSKNEVDPRTGKRKKIVLEDVGSDDIALLYAGPDTKIQDMVLRIQMAEAAAHGGTIAESIADDYPELLAEGVGLNASGEARKEARRKAENKIRERRSSYDDGLRRALQMAMTMGGISGFGEAFPFTESSFEDGEMDFSIGNRPVFEDDPAEQQAREKSRADREKVMADTLRSYTDTGLPMETVLKRLGWSEDEIKDAVELMDELTAAAQQTTPTSEMTIPLGIATQ